MDEVFTKTMEKSGWTTNTNGSVVGRDEEDGVSNH